MLQQGEILNNTYQVIGEIGSGGGGTVYRAYHLNLKKDVVLKLINDKAKKSLDARGEVDILKNVKHTYLPTVFDFQEVNGQIYTVMDFVQGSDFSQLLKEGHRFEQKDVIKWASQLCEALDYLHRQDPPIIHSDIKPANIMLTPKGDICLIDFNVSQLFSDSGTVVRGRTHGYAPPEQYETSKGRRYTYSEETELDDTVMDDATVTDGAASASAVSVKATGFGVSQKLDARSDIYSLGATLYHILSGVRPNHSMQPQVPIRSKVPDISEGLEYIINKAMSFDQKKRFSSAAEMLKAVKNIHQLDKMYKDRQKKKKTTRLLYTVMFIVSLAVSVLGINTISADRGAQYDKYIDEGIALVERYDIDGAMECAETTIKKYPGKVGGHYVKAYALTRSRDYETADSYIRSYLTGNPLPADEKDYVGAMFHIMGICLFNMEDYAKAESAFSEAAALVPDDSNIYRYWAVTCVRMNNFEKAAELIEKARRLPHDESYISIIEAEINYANGNYSAVYGVADKVFAQSTDNANREQVVLLESDAALAQGDYAHAAQVLENARAVMPKQSTMSITQDLAEIYALMGRPDNVEYTLKAVACFNELIELGFSPSTIMLNVAVLYQNINYFTEAAEMLDRVEEKYPDDYRTYMQRTFLEIDIQASRPNADRNYGGVLNSYNKAVSLYEKSPDYGNDIQMMMLQSYINDLRNHGWI